MRRAAALLLALTACTSAPPTDPGGGVTPFPVAIGDGHMCSGTLSPPVIGAGHIAPPETGSYSTDPPTSGVHYSIGGVAPHPAGVATRPVPDEAQVHNLEHGHVIVHYRDLDEAGVAELRAAVLADPVQMLLTERPTMGWAFALTAWGKIAVCSELPPNPANMINAFVEMHRGPAGDAPEKNVL